MFPKNKMLTAHTVLLILIEQWANIDGEQDTIAGDLGLQTDLEGKVFHTHTCPGLREQYAL